MKRPRIGIDFDNTIVCYDDVFYKAAVEKKLIPESLSPSKTQIRDFFRSNGRESEWTQLQGYIYGSRMELASSFSGVDLFFSFCKEKNIDISIISHKTRHPYLGPKYDLHQAAKNWLLQQPFFHSDLNVFFELTLPEKLRRIEEERCDLFIDDLPELLCEPNFPTQTRKILFDPANHYDAKDDWTQVNSWNQMLSILPQLIHF